MFPRAPTVLGHRGSFVGIHRFHREIVWEQSGNTVGTISAQIYGLNRQGTNLSVMGSGAEMKITPCCN